MHVLTQMHTNTHICKQTCRTFVKKNKMSPAVSLTMFFIASNNLLKPQLTREINPWTYISVITETIFYYPHPATRVRIEMNWLYFPSLYTVYGPDALRYRNIYIYLVCLHFSS